VVVVAAENLDAAAVSAEEYKVILTMQRKQQSGLTADVAAADVVVVADADREAVRTVRLTPAPTLPPTPTLLPPSPTPTLLPPSPTQAGAAQRAAPRAAVATQTAVMRLMKARKRRRRCRCMAMNRINKQVMVKRRVTTAHKARVWREETPTPTQRPSPPSTPLPSPATRRKKAVAVVAAHVVAAEILAAEAVGAAQAAAQAAAQVAAAVVAGAQAAAAVKKLSK